MGKTYSLFHPHCYGGYGRGYTGDDSDPAGVYVAGLEAKDWKAQSALGCPVQVGRVWTFLV